jgi:hypothetical protein
MDDARKQTTMTSSYDDNATGTEIIKGRDFTGYHAIVTGANRGVGLELAKTLALSGCYVILGCRNVTNAQTICDSIAKERVGFYYCDHRIIYTENRD